MHATARYKPRSPLGLMLLGAAALLLAGSARATIINPDFSSGFDGWQAQRVDSFTLDVEDVTPEAPEFTIPGGGVAKLSNSFDYFEVALFQSFMLGADVVTVAMDYGWMITDSVDLVQLSLRNLATNDIADLFDLAGLDPTDPSGSGRLEVDISAFAGAQVELLGFVQDGDFDEQEMLSFGNIVFASAPVSVPAPASGLLVILGTLLVALRRGT